MCFKWFIIKGFVGFFKDKGRKREQKIKVVREEKRNRERMGEKKKERKERGRKKGRKVWRNGGREGRRDIVPCNTYSKFDLRILN